MLLALLLSRTRLLSAGLVMALSFGSAPPTSGGAPEPPAPASATRDIMFHRIKANQVLFLGNSITLHGPAPAIGWLGNWGMAASTPEKDYVHLVLAAIGQQAGRAPQSLVLNMADFERQYGTYDIDAKLEKALAFRADLVIIAIGENVPALTTDQSKADFQASVTRLLKKLKANGDPVIVVRSCFWQNPPKDTALAKACSAVGGIFVDNSFLGKDAANMARSERHFAHDGVAAHPGDRGMKAIADSILQALSKR